MLEKTRGIVLRTTDYGETSLVVKVFTEAYGLQSYIVNSVRKPGAKTRASVFQPLSLLELVVYHKDRGGLQRASEIRNFPPYRHLPFDMQKSSIVLFLDEVLNKVLQEGGEQQEVFEFLVSSLQLLDLQQPANPDFHLAFLLRLTRLLGFVPAGAPTEATPVFDLQEGVFCSQVPPHPHYLTGEECTAFGSLIEATNDFSKLLQWPLPLKRVMTERLLDYYRLHVPGFGEVRGHKVLEAVWG